MKQKKKKEVLFISGPFIHINMVKALEEFYNKYPDIKEKDISKEVMCGEAVPADTQISLRFSMFKETVPHSATKEEEDGITIRNMFRAYLKGQNFILDGEHYIYLDL